MRVYALKRRKTKYYKEVVTEGETWSCFKLGDEVFPYLKNPYSVGDYFYNSTDGSLATSVSDLKCTTISVGKINSDGSVSFYMSVLPGGDPTEFPLTPYPSGDLTTTTTELVESTKDDYDIVKNEDSFYTLQRRGNKKPNVTKIGSPTINNGVVSGFSASNYLKLPMVFTPVDKPWEIKLKFATGSIGTRQKIFAHVAGLDWLTPTINIETDGEISLNISTSGSSWLINRSSNIVKYILNVNTEYEVIAQFTGSSYIMKVKSTSETEYTTVLNYSSTSAFYQNVAVTPTIGFENYGGTYTFLGSIDLNESYIKINGEPWWSGMIYNNNSYLLCREKN